MGMEFGGGGGAAKKRGGRGRGGGGGGGVVFLCVLLVVPLLRGACVLSFELVLDAVVLGVLLGCFYAAVSLGLSVSFGLLDVPHVAHPAFLVMASSAVFFLTDHFGIDPLLAGLLITPLFFLFGLAAYRLYYETFEK